MTSQMEVCVDSVQSAVNSEKGGASRIELCSALSEGGLTPSLGLLQVVCESCSLPVFAMVRPRAGDFLYSDQEFTIMKRDIQLMKKKSTLTGFVFGILTRDGAVDMERCQELVEICKPKQITFHRAIDMTADPLHAMEQIINLGFERILTSGGESTALEGAPMIHQMVKQAQDRIIIVPGGGVSASNIQRILDQTSAQEFHASCRISLPSGMDHQHSGVSMGATLSMSEFTQKVTCSERVRRIKNIGETSVVLDQL